MNRTELPYSEALAGLREYQAQLARRPIYSSERAGYIESELAEELGERIDDLEAALRGAEQSDDASWTLSPEASKRLFELLENPPEPNEALKALFRKHSATVQAKSDTRCTCKYPSCSHGTFSKCENCGCEFPADVVWITRKQLAGIAGRLFAKQGPEYREKSVAYILHCEGIEVLNG